MSLYEITFFPLAFIFLSAVVIYFSKKKLSLWIGKKPEWDHLIPIFFIAAQLLIVGLGVNFAASFLHINDTQAVDEAVRALNQDPVYSVVTLGLSSMGEELFFRGILFTILGPIVSSIFFGLFHAGYGSIIQIIGSFVAGLVLCRSREKYESIFPGIAGHFLYNVIVVFIFGG